MPDGNSNINQTEGGGRRKRNGKEKKGRENNYKCAKCVPYVHVKEKKGKEILN